MRGINTVIICVWEASETEASHLEFWREITKCFELDVIDKEAWA